MNGGHSLRVAVVPCWPPSAAERIPEMKEDHANVALRYMEQHAPHLLKKMTRELRFHKNSYDLYPQPLLARFDFAWPEFKVAVEIDGGRWIKARGGGRHGSDKDYNKINQASLEGWYVLRYTSTMLNNTPMLMLKEITILLAGKGHFDAHEHMRKHILA